MTDVPFTHGISRDRWQMTPEEEVAKLFVQEETARHERGFY
jgi:hypothetical protein